MKKKTAILAVIMCFALLFSGCTKEVTFKEYHKDTTYEDYAPLLNHMEKIPELSGMTCIFDSEEILAFCEAEDPDGEVVFYNLDDSSIVMRKAMNAVKDAEFFTVNEHTFIILQESGTTVSAEEYDNLAAETPAAATEPAATEAPAAAEEETEKEKTVQLPQFTVYDAKGIAVASAYSTQDLDDMYHTEQDLFCFDGVIYRVAENGSISEVVSDPFFGGIPEITYKTDKYYYAFEDTEVTVYDASLNTVLYWEAPHSDIEDCLIMPLGGNLLVQTFTPLFDFETEYDFIADETKYALESYIISAKGGKVTSVDLEYIVSSTMASAAPEEWDSEEAYIYKIENRRVLDATSAIEFVSLNKNSGKIEQILLSDIHGFAYSVAEDRFMYMSYNGDTYLMNGKGKILGKINTIGNLAASDRNQCYIALNGKLYNYDLAEVYNYTEENLFVEEITGHSVIFKDLDKNLHLYNREGVLSHLPEESKLYLCKNQFFVLESEDRYTVFNEDGTKLGNIGSADRVITISNNADMRILAAKQENGYEFYKISYVAEK